MKGRVLQVSGDAVWVAQGRALLVSLDAGQSWARRGMLPAHRSRDWFTGTRLGRRLCRVGFHHLVPTSDDAAVIVAHDGLYELLPGDPTVRRVASLVGSRPLALCGSDGNVVYGEYRQNADRTPVRVFMAGMSSAGKWSAVWEFKSVRHIHGVFSDPFTRAYWVTTGDSDSESAIWMTRDGFKTLEQVAGGSQKCRAVQLLFTEDYVYFGTDSPDDRNYIRRLSRSNGRVEDIAEVSGPIFYGCTVGGHLFFSTVVEPSEVNRRRFADVWGSADGWNWHTVASYRKDVWPMRLFQYGQVLFPSGPGDGANLWLTPMGTESDQRVMKLPVAGMFG